MTIYVNKKTIGNIVCIRVIPVDV